MTAAPSRANRRAMALPQPEPPPPVTSATRPWSSPRIGSLVDTPGTSVNDKQLEIFA